MKNCIAILMFLSFIFVPNANAQLFKDIKKNIKKAGQKIDNALSKQKKVTQTKEETPAPQSTRQRPQEESIQFEKGIMFDAPNDNFFNFELQSFRGLPRLGVLNGYGYYNPRVRGGSSTRDNQQVRAEMKDLGYAYAKYYQLLKTKYLAPFFEVMDKDMPYSVKYGSHVRFTYKEGDERSSNIAQIHLKRVAYILLSQSSFQNYFCAPNSDCNLSFKKNRTTPKFPRWSGKDEFEVIETYKKFINENYKSLRDWSAQIMEEGYFVEKVRFEQYDFKKGGFHLRFSPGISVQKFRSANKVIYNIQNQQRLSFAYLFKMDTSEAKALIERKDEKKLGRHLFAVYKVKYYAVGNSGKSWLPSEKLSLLHHITIPVIELYEDEALTKKLGEIPINQGE